jgi:hypothetical protein
MKYHQAHHPAPVLSAAHDNFSWKHLNTSKSFVGSKQIMIITSTPSFFFYLCVKMATDPDLRSPMGILSIRGWRWDDFAPQRGINGQKMCPVG